MTTQQSSQWQPTTPQPDIQQAILERLIGIHAETAATRKAVQNIWTVVLIWLILGAVGIVLWMLVTGG